jgi:SAM-dependent methyltransferase
MSEWDHPAAAEYYEAFCQSHSRYIDANTALVSRAAIRQGMQILDLGAGTGRTVEAVLPLAGPTGRVVCVEPFGAMRKCGMRRITDARVEWRCDLPGPPRGGPLGGAGFDRILSGAAIWQLEPLEDWIRKLSEFLRPGGALCFTVPAMNLCEPDEPGGGRDPLLLELLCLLCGGKAVSGEKAVSGAQAATKGWQMTRPALTAMLRRAHFRTQSWSFRNRLTQKAYADWLKIPVLTERMFPGVDPAERARRIDSALAGADRDSWKWERWRGWTAWKH